jgi:hypothetical protein
MAQSPLFQVERILGQLVTQAIEDKKNVHHAPLFLNRTFFIIIYIHLQSFGLSGCSENSEPLSYKNLPNGTDL